MIKKLPTGSRAWVKIKHDDKEYLIASNPDRSRYTLYLVLDGGYERIASGANPFDLEENNIWHTNKKKRKDV